MRAERTRRPTPVDISRTVGEDRLPICQWPSADGPRHALIGVLVTNGRYTEFDQFAADYEAGLGEPIDPGLIYSVEGIGTLGVWITLDERSRMLRAYQPPRMVQVSVETNPGRDPVDAAQPLARAALDRLM